MKIPRLQVVSSVGIILSVSSALGFPADLESLLKRLSDPSESVRRAAWEGAAQEAGAAAIGPLAALASGDHREAALAASRAIDCIAHAAGAPGSPGRKDAAAALAGILERPGASEPVKLRALDLLSSVGEAEIAPALAKALADPKLCDFARKALERIPGASAEKALDAALAGASGELRDALIVSLGKKRARGSVAALTRLAAGEGSSRLAAATALAMIGDPAGIAAIQSVIRAASPRDRSTLTDEYLEMGDRLRKAGDEASARKIYQDVLSTSDEDTRRYAALHSIYSDGSEKDTGALVGAIDDASPRIRSLALELLASLKGDDINKTLLERFTAARGSQKAAFLRVLAARKAPGVERSLDAALGDADVDVKVTALELAGRLSDPANEAILAAALEKGSAPVKDVAAKACLDLADAKSKSDAAQAAKMYSRVFDVSQDASDKGRALLGLAGVAGVPADASLARIEAARKDPVLAGSANQAYVLHATAVGRSGKKEEAIAMLQSVVSSGAARETVRMAIASLKEFGGDPSVLQKKQGFLVSWKLMGPFPNKDGKGFDTAYSPEQEVRFDGTQKDDRGRDRKWQDFQSTAVDGKVDLRQAFQRSNDVCAYAYAELESPDARDVRLKIGSDDGVIGWLNGKKIHANNATRPCQVDEDVVNARLDAGKNRILLKITQGGGEWEFALRLTDRKDRPLDLTALGK